jgi:AraC family transcriptional regulator
MSVSLHLPANAFYGRHQARRAAGPFDLRALDASGREEDVRLHTHADAHFVFVLAGVYISSARAAPDFAPAPCLVFNPPGTTHRDRFVGGRGRFATLSFPASAYGEIAAEQALSPDAVRLGHPAAMAAGLRLARELARAGDDALAEACAWDLMAATDAAPAPLAPPAWAHRAFEQVMDGAADAALSVADLAREAAVHPVHLARVFRAAWRCSPGELLRWRRVERACALLAQPLPAAEIAAAVGFADQAHMTRAFRAELGLTPGAWRTGHVAPIQDPALLCA